MIQSPYLKNSKRFIMEYGLGNENDYNKLRGICYTDVDSIFKNYYTADVLIVDDDPILLCLFENKIKKMRIKSNLEDEGRDIKYKTINNSKELLSNILEYKCTYGLILIDENLGPDSHTGSQCIKRLRESGYNRPIFSISGSFKPNVISDKIKKAGADGLIPKSPFFFSEIKKILFKLVKRVLVEN